MATSVTGHSVGVLCSILTGPGYCCTSRIDSGEVTQPRSILEHQCTSDRPARSSCRRLTSSPAEILEWLTTLHGLRTWKSLRLSAVGPRSVVRSRQWACLACLISFPLSDSAAVQAQSVTKNEYCRILRRTIHPQRNSMSIMREEKW